MMSKEKVVSTSDLPPALLGPARLVGFTLSVACQEDERASYSLYIPEQHYNPDPANIEGVEDCPPKLPIVVLVHGSTRQTLPLLTAFKSLADTHKCALLAPFYAAGIDGINNWDGYKNLEPEVTLRLDPGECLKCMISYDIAARWPGLRTDNPLILAGFSGGACFVQQFALLNFGFVQAVSLAAPAHLTKLSWDDWPEGYGGTCLELEYAHDNAHVAWQLVVGSEDTALEGSIEKLAKVSQNWKEEEAKVNGCIDWIEKAKKEMQPRSRRELLEEFRDSLCEQGVAANVEIVDGAGHNLAQLAPAIERFLEKEVDKYWELTTQQGDESDHS